MVIRQRLILTFRHASASLASSLVSVHVPAEVSRGSFMNNRRDAGKIGGDVVLETVFANVVEQFLQSGNFNDAGAAKRF